MIDLDGADGGGQLVRTALALSAITGEAFRMENVRGDRSTPGLRPQHLAAVHVAAAVTGARVDGAAVGSETVEYRPGPVSPGAYGVDVGTAGSVSLVFDTVLPLVAVLDAPLTVAIRGGTDVKWAPPAAYYERVKLPLLRRFGVGAAVDYEKRGFYPAGGGVATLRLFPSAVEPLRLSRRGPRRGVRVYSTAEDALADAEVAERQAEAATDRLEAAGTRVIERKVTYVDAESPGSALVVRADHERSLAGFDALGERGKPAEEVAAEAAEAAVEFEEGCAAVDRHASDQLIPFLALAGGRVLIPEVTDHVHTNRRLVSAFGFDVRVERTDAGPVLAADPDRRVD